MSEKKKFVFCLIACFFISAAGMVCGVAGYRVIFGAIIRDYGNRSSDEVTQLSERNDQLNREYAERQRIIEERQRSIEAGITECIGYVKNAGIIIERTSQNTSGAISNLREASAYIEQGIKERESLKMELDNLRASLYRLRGVAGVEAE